MNASDILLIDRLRQYLDGISGIFQYLRTRGGSLVDQDVHLIIIVTFSDTRRNFVDGVFEDERRINHALGRRLKVTAFRQSPRVRNRRLGTRSGSA